MRKEPILLIKYLKRERFIFVLKQETVFDKTCPKCNCVKTITKITENSQYVLCEQCRTIRSRAQWFY